MTHINILSIISFTNQIANLQIIQDKTTMLILTTSQSTIILDTQLERAEISAQRK